MDSISRTRVARQYLFAAGATLAVSLFQLGSYLWLNAQSISLLGDTFHAFNDAGGLFLSLYVIGRVSTSVVDGSAMHRRVTLINIALLIVGSLFAAYELVDHMHHRIMPTISVLVVAIIGAAGDWYIQRMLKSVDEHGLPDSLKRNHTINLIHIKQDYWLSIAVVISGVAIWLGAPYVDLVLGGIVVWIVLGEAVQHLCEELFDATPRIVRFVFLLPIIQLFHSHAHVHEEVSHEGCDHHGHHHH